jgi:hypothetical protein
MSHLEEFAFLTNEQFLLLPRKEQVGYLRRATEELAQRSLQLRQLVAEMEKTQIAMRNVYPLPPRHSTAQRDDKHIA